MTRRRPVAGRWLGALAAALAAAGCTVHPAGERAAREQALQAGKPYEHAPERRSLPVLTPASTSQELANYALLSNGAVEQRYWEWRAALERVPQEGTQQAELLISLSSLVTQGRMAWDTTTLMAGNDPMNSIVAPGKLRTAAEAALEEAKAAGLRFDKARLEVAAKVRAAYADYALAAEEARLDEGDIQLLATAERLVEARLATGGGKQEELLTAVNELELARNALAARRAEYPRLLAAINALLNRAARAAIDLPGEIPAVRMPAGDDDELLALAARSNPELLAEARDIAAKGLWVKRAKQEYVPDFGVTVGTDLQGMAQSLAGAIVLPAVRHQAIDAAIEQAKAVLRQAEAMRRQAGSDLAGQMVAELAGLREAQRQADFFEKGVLPRLEKIVTATRNSYATGRATMAELVDTERAMIAARRMAAEMRTSEEQRAASLGALAGVDIAPTDGNRARP